MRRSVFLSAAMCVFAFHGAAQDAYSPPPVGTMVTWSFGDETSRETRISEVVASGEDFVVYLTDLRFNENSANSYVVEFSGIHVVSCATKMPNIGERERLASAWPLQSGETVEIAGDLAAKYTIGRLTSHTLNVLEGPTQARLIKATFGSVENDITLSLNWNMPVAVGWPDGTGDKALEVLPPTDAAQPRTNLRRALGNCAALLDE